MLWLVMAAGCSYLREMNIVAAQRVNDFGMMMCYTQSDVWVSSICSFICIRRYPYTDAQEVV